MSTNDPVHVTKENPAAGAKGWIKVSTAEKCTLQVLVGSVWVRSQATDPNADPDPTPVVKDNYSRLFWGHQYTAPGRDRDFNYAPDALEDVWVKAVSEHQTNVVVTTTY